MYYLNWLSISMILQYVSVLVKHFNVKTCALSSITTKITLIDIKTQIHLLSSKYNLT